MESNQPQLPPIDRNGQCPNCEKGWDGGDILQELAKIDAFRGQSQSGLLKLAANYGYTISNPIRFTKLEGIELPKLENRAFWRCPYCFHVWDKVTNHHYVNLNQALRPLGNNTIIDGQ